MDEEQLDVSTALAGSRFPAWTSLTIFSGIAMISHLTTDGSSDGAAEKWVTSVTAISLGLGFCAMLTHFVASANFVGQPAEGGVAFFIIVFWAAGLPVIMNPNNAIAVSGDGILNANLYFFSWASFVADGYILAAIAKASNFADISATPPKVGKWLGLFAVSVIVMASSIRYFDLNGCSSGSSSVCRRAAYSISLGAIGLVVSGILSFLATRGTASIMVELVSSFLMFGMYAFGTGFSTFGEGPATSLGNLYFSTWGGFILSMVLFAECVKEYNSVGMVEDDEPSISGGGADIIDEAEDRV